MDGFAYLPGTDDTFVELSRTKSGKLFRKHILSTGVLNYPGAAGGKVTIDDVFLSTLKTNFDNNVCDIVQVPVAGASNEHSEDPYRNIGEVVDFRVENGKGYAYIDARDEVAASKLGKTLLGASAMLHLNYTDTRDGEKKGPTLLHVAVTNRPHVVELEDFEELLISASADGSDEAVFLTANEKENSPMTLDEIIRELKDEHDIDLPALQLSASDAENVATLSNTLQKALVDSGVLKLSNSDNASSDDLVAAVSQLASDRVELSGKVDALIEDSTKKAAESRVDTLIAEGFIAPVKRDVNIALLLSNAETFEALLPEKPFVTLSQENGQEPLDETPANVIASEIARLSAVANPDQIIHA